MATLRRRRDYFVSSTHISRRRDRLSRGDIFVLARLVLWLTLFGFLISDRGRRVGA